MANKGNLVPKPVQVTNANGTTFTRTQMVRPDIEAAPGVKNRLSGAPKLSAPTSGPTVDYDELGTTELAEQVVEDFGIYTSSAHNEGFQRNEAGWEHTRWEIELEGNGGKKLNVGPYLMGTAHGSNTPQPEQIIENWIDEARGFEQNGSLDSWAHSYGYDIDDPEERARCRKSYRQAGKQCEQMKKFFGLDNYRKIVGPTAIY